MPLRERGLFWMAGTERKKVRLGAEALWGAVRSCEGCRHFGRQWPFLLPHPASRLAMKRAYGTPMIKVAMAKPTASKHPIPTQRT